MLRRQKGPTYETNYTIQLEEKKEKTALYLHDGTEKVAWGLDI